MLPDAVKALDKLLDQRPTPDPAQVQGEVDAHLTTRGRHLAQGMGLGQVSDNDLRDLGELDAIAQHPTLPPALAVHLETIAANLERTRDSARAHPVKPPEPGNMDKRSATGTARVASSGAGSEDSSRASYGKGMAYLYTGRDGCGATVSKATIDSHIQHHELTQTEPTVYLIPKRRS